MESDVKYYITALDKWLMKHIITCKISREMWGHIIRTVREKVGH